jgi:phosphopantetheinyl transferase
MARCPVIVAFTSLHELSATEIASLSRSELVRADEFKSSHRRQEYLCARALLRNILQHFTGEPASSHELTTDDKGKPVCTHGPAISIAHSGDFVVCAATDHGQIGVDIEVPGHRRDVSGIANRFYAADEVEWLAEQPEDRFYMLWVLKEAWLKAKGTGIAGGLSRLRCFVTPPDIEARISDDSTPALSLHAIEGALIGVATTSGLQGNLTIDRWDPVSGRFEKNGNIQLIATTS